jgi:hypothetical protein
VAVLPASSKAASATSTARSSPRESAALRAIGDPASGPPTLMPTSSVPRVSASSRATSIATGSYSLTAPLARDQSTVPSAPIETSCGLRAHL